MTSGGKEVADNQKSKNKLPELTIWPIASSPTHARNDIQEY